MIGLRHAAWLYFHGRLPQKRQLKFKCKIDGCIHPAHQDIPIKASYKARERRDEIRARYMEFKEKAGRPPTLRALGNYFGVTQTTVLNAVKGIK